VIIQEEAYLAHYGILRKSGRYPWGSGGPEYASNKSFLGMVEGMRKQGMSESEIARGLGVTTTQLRAAKSIAANEERQANIAMAQRLKEKGLSNVAIGQRMGVNESSVRSLLAPGVKDKADILEATSTMLKDQVAQKGLIDIGTGVEHHLGISQTKLSTAVARLQEEGYKVHYVKVQQLGTGKQTTLKVLSAPDVPYSEVWKNKDSIKPPFDSNSDDGGRSYLGMQTPLSISSKRVGINYAEDGGTKADGVIYVRPGVPDISLGSNRYAQVRIMVDGTHYLKGMALYKDDLPDGVDLQFNTNKSNKGDKLKALKELKTDKSTGKIDEDNPFGAVVRQITEPGPGGKRKVTSAMNIVNEDSDWDKWSKSLSTQVLSKQSPVLAKQQLDLTYQRRKSEFDEISSLTNPAVKQKLLESFADGTDSAAVHLKAAALPGQKTHVILPMDKMKETEIYAPNYDNGTRVALIRYPHGGKFEIPELVVNNKQPDAKKLLGDTRNAVGINHKVAERLSGADFDGDTVLVIPNDSGKIKSEPALARLKGFDPQSAYPAYEGMPKMSARTKQTQMGLVSNLITDMTIHGANNAEIASAVRHSMVVIDAEKHNLNYKQSAIDNGIPALMKKYQGRSQGGAATLISRATSPTRVDERKPRSAANGGPIDKATGKKMYEPTGNSYVNSMGKTVVKSDKSTKLAETDDAYTLSSGTTIEKVYADHSNKLKALANDARRVMVNTQTTPYSPSAKAAYSNEVASLNAKLTIALRNAPLERQAQVVANAVYSQKLDAYPDADAAEKKKIKSQALTEARTRVGASKTRVEITPSEWAAIQAGAISNERLSKILSNTDLDKIKELATPRTQTLMNSASKARADSMLAAGYTQAEVASALGVSVSTLQRGVSEG
jgi:DNA-binding CsgD family transcriptional regulator